MGQNQTTVDLVAGGSLSPWRAVKLHTTRRQGVVAAARANIVIGVTDGSTKGHDSALHAESGDDIQFQSGDLLTIECGETVAIGELVCASSGGRAFDADTGDDAAFAVALETGLVGERILVFRTGLQIIDT